MLTISKKSLVLIQSRFNSNRLPGKALLPIEGIPMVVLAALRAANTGKEVIVLTSSESTDDELCKVIDKYNINYFRGSLENVLDRFYRCTFDQSDQKIIFRLTADNVLPDGHLLDEMERDFCSQDVDIMNCTPKLSNMPYGVSAEIFRVKKLREAFKNVENDFDREHVTPYIYRNGKYNAFRSIKFSGFSNFRATIDTFDDYISVKSLFKDVHDIVNEPIYSLLHKLNRMQYKSYPIKPMTLGTVQFGLDYGITNRFGKVKKKEAIEIIKYAIVAGTEYLDTASDYGESELILGEALKGGWGDRIKVITKLPSYKKETYLNEKSWALVVRNSVAKSCLNLNTIKIDTLMFHRSDLIFIEPIIKEVIQLKNEKIINRIGVSIQTPSELEFVLDKDFISIIQLPFNILDYRWDLLIPKIKVIKEKRNLIIHARSSLLQGLLCSEDKNSWIKAGINNFQEVIDWLDRKFKQHEKMSVSDLCIGYVNSQNWIDSVVIGVDSISNLYSNLQSISTPYLSEYALNDIYQSRPKINESSLNPSTWS